MRVCLIAPVPPFRGGIAKYCYSLAKELEKKHDLLLLSFKRLYPGFLYDRKRQIDINLETDCIRKEFRNLSYDIDSVNIISWVETSKRVAAFAPDVVILPWWVVYWMPMYAYLLNALKKKGIRVVLLCINVYEHEDNFLKKFLTKFIINRSNYIVVHSEQEKNELLEINKKACVRKHLLPLFQYTTENINRHDTACHLLFFGFVRPYKGLDILLHALALLKDYDISLKVVGEFWTDKGEYLTLINDLDISDMVTIDDRYVADDEMSRCFSWADLIVLPYRTAKTSGVIATAYGFGKPVLATDVGGFHEVVMDGCTGKLVPPGAPGPIADGIRWFCDNRLVNFEDNIASFVLHNMSWSSLVNTIEGMIAHAE